MGGVRHLGYRGEQVLAYVNDTIRNNGRAPSYAMIAEDLGLSSISDVCAVIRRLERRGYLTRTDTGSRHRRGWHQPVIAIRA